jgi:hypothetical protein
MLNFYNPDTFTKLNGFNEAKDLLNQHRRKLTDLGKVIIAHNMHEKVGVSLLHKHFDLLETEKLVEKFSKNDVSVEPRKSEDLGNIVPYLWKLDSFNENKLPSYLPLEFIEVSSTTKEAADLYNFA